MKTVHRLFLFVCLWLCSMLQFLPLIGCARIPSKAKAPAVKVATPAGVVLEQNGDAVKPANVETNTQTTVAPIPAGSVVSVNPASGEIKYTLSRDSTVTTTAHREKAEGPQAFTPPVPPTPAQLAQGDGVRYFWVASLCCVVLAGLLAWRTHFLAAICCGAAAVALPMLANFVSSDSARLVGGILVAAGVAFFAAWHVLKPKLVTNPLKPIPGPLAA